MTTSDLEAAFSRAFALLAADYPQPVREYRFHPTRKWRFDFAWPRVVCGVREAGGVAVEIEGGSWSQGRHTRGAGYAGDCAKYNAAVMSGWRVLRFTSDMLYSDLRACVAQVVALLDGEQRY